MLKVILLYLLTYIQFIHGQTASSGSCPTPEGAREVTKLRSKIFCQYDKSSRPVQNLNSTVNVNVTFILHSINMESYSEKMFVEFTLFYTWRDEYLNWDSADEIKYFHLGDADIWVPDLVFQRRTNFESKLHTDTQYCFIMNTGQVTCEAQRGIEVSCMGKLRHWPYDTHTCDLFISSFGYYDHELNITSMKYCGGQYKDGKCQNFHGILMSNFQSNTAWELISGSTTKTTTYFYDNMTYSLIKYSFLVKRHSEGIEASTVIPAIVCLFTILSTFWMGVKTKVRVIMCCTVFISSTTYLTYLIYLIPPSGDEIPMIMILFRDACTLSMFAAFIAVATRRLLDKPSAPPLWLSGLADYLHDRWPKIILLLESTIAKSVTEDEAAILAGNSKVEGPWAPTAQIIDRLAFISCFLTCLILLLGYLP